MQTEFRLGRCRRSFDWADACRNASCVADNRSSSCVSTRARAFMRRYVRALRLGCECVNVCVGTRKRVRQMNRTCARGGA
eukprot:6176303-Pleurochrysis_carterae.AAC.1